MVLLIIYQRKDYLYIYIKKRWVLGKLFDEEGERVRSMFSPIVFNEVYNIPGRSLNSVIS